MAAPSTVNECLQSICQSAAYQDWQQSLIAHFYDKERKDIIIRQTRAVIAQQMAHLSAEDIESLQATIITKLIGAALQTVQPSSSPAPAPQTRTPQELEDLVIDHFPYPIAVCYHRLTEAETGAGACGCLLDTFESLLHFLTTALLSVYWRDGATDAGHNRRLLEKLYKGKWSAGTLLELLRETARLYLNKPDALPYPQLSTYLFNKNGSPSKSLSVLNHLVELRNLLAHGGGRDDRYYAAILPESRSLLEAELGRLDFLVSRALWLPKEVSEAGLVTIGHAFNGNRRRKDRPLSLQLDPRDLSINGGDIKPEQTLLLVDESSGKYLPMFPLSLFHFQLNGQGIFFLNDLAWAEKAERLKKARYLAYDMISTDKRGNHYEVTAGEFAATKIEARVRQLARSVQAQGIGVETIAPGVRETNDYDLPEVWAEQASHLKTFAGRAERLRRIQDWVDQSEEGGYLLLLGPPGQGKSALLAQFASHRMNARQDCLLHMVKSHKNPRRFLQFLIWQAETLIDEPLAQVSYQGNIEDSRNALVGALDKLSKKRGRCLIVLDALDELDISGERIDFLPENLPAGVRVVLSCRPEIPLVVALQRRLRNLTVEHLPALSAADLPLFLARYLEASQLDDLRKKVDFEALFDRTQGNPLFFKRALERILEAVRRSRERGVPIPHIDISAFPNTVEAVFEDIYNETTGKMSGEVSGEGVQLRSSIIRLLSIAREALSIDALRGLLSAQAATVNNAPAAPLDGRAFAYSLEAVRDAVMQISEYLLSYEGEKFLLFHQGFNDYLHRKLLGADGLIVAHQVFCRWMSGPAQQDSLYRLRHLPTHLRECAERLAAIGLEDEARHYRDELQRWLTNFDYLQTRVRADMIFELVRDFQSVLPVLQKRHDQTTDKQARPGWVAKLLSAFHVGRSEALPSLEDWYKFLDSESHILVQHPRLFLQQALNQPSQSPIARVAESRIRPCGPASLCETYLRWINKPAVMTALPLRRTLTGHTDWVSAIALTPNGLLVVSGSDDMMVKVWDLARGQCVATLEGHKGPVRAVAISPCGTRAISGGGDRMLFIWDLTSGQCLNMIEAHKELISAIAISRDGREAISASWDKTIKVWNLSDERCVRVLEGHTEPVSAIELSEDGEAIISGSRDNTVKIWRQASGECMATLAGHTDWVNDVAVIPGQNKIVSASSDGTLNVWDLDSRRCVATLAGHTRPVWAVEVSADGKRALSGSSERALKVWNLDNAQCVATLEGHTEPVEALAIHPQGRLAVSASRDKTLKVWDLTGGDVRATTQRHVGYVTSIAITPDGRQALLATIDGSIKLWSLTNDKLQATLYGHSRPVRSVAVTPDGKYGISGSSDKTLRVWDLSTAKAVGLSDKAGHTQRVSAVAVTPDGTYALSASADRSIKVWHLEQWQCAATFRAHVNRISALAVFSSGDRVVVGGEDGMLKVWTLSSMELFATLEGHRDWISSIAVTADDSRCVSASRDGSLKVWDARSRRCVRTLAEHKGAVVSLALTVDSKQVISASEDGTLRVWDMETGQVVAIFPAAGAVSACAVSPSGRIVFTDASEQIYQLSIEQSSTPDD